MLGIWRSQGCELFLKGSHQAGLSAALSFGKDLKKKKKKKNGGRDEKQVLAAGGPQSASTLADKRLTALILKGVRQQPFCLWALG